ncbi:DnaJ-domain-containing protein [Gyrodon lividus]|nr:DnaJ-domain-containing protein [Gyrodon lividus]
MGVDYYKILDVSPNATEDEVKRAYKKMALKWHPDRNQGSEEASRRFKEISEAFEVLSDNNKRKIYDQVGEEGLKGGGAPPGAGFSGSGGFPGATSFTFTTGPGGAGGFSPTDPQRVFEQMFARGFPGLSSIGGMGGRSPMSSVFDDDIGSSFFGDMPGGIPHHASTGPQRATSAPAPQPPEITRPLKLSLEDLYSGATKHLKVSRKLLSGATEDKVLEIQVLPGWKSGTKIRFPRAGNEQPNRESQDLVFVTEEKPHPMFTRNGDDLICYLKIPLLQALTGSDTKKVVEALDGRKIQVPVPAEIVKPGQETRISGEGMPIRKQGNLKKKGDLIIRWDVQFPDRLTPSQKESLRRVLG